MIIHCYTLENSFYCGQKLCCNKSNSCPLQRVVRCIWKLNSLRNEQNLPPYEIHGQKRSMQGQIELLQYISLNAYFIIFFFDSSICCNFSWIVRRYNVIKMYPIKTINNGIIQLNPNNVADMCNPKQDERVLISLHFAILSLRNRQKSIFLNIITVTPCIYIKLFS